MTSLEFSRTAGGKHETEVAPDKVLVVYDRTPFGWRPVEPGSGEHSQIYLLALRIVRPAQEETP
jgi:hypothetical protein